ncbi:MAG: SDR family NAD(P)-dependent oxidoreductase, partial [Roseibacillus sp.]
MNTIDLQNKCSVITGGARGIGFAIAQRLTASGARCAIWDRDEDAAVAAAQSLDGAVPVTVDVTNAGAVEAATATTLDQLGAVDILVNNAGIAGASKKLWQCTPEEWQEVLQIDLFGVFLCCRALVPQMVERNYGRIVNIASIAGKEGNPNASHYSAAKAGVIGLTKSLAKETAQNGVIVNCVTPAVIETDILKQIT